MTESTAVKIKGLEVQMTDNKTQLNRVETKVDTLIIRIDILTQVQTEVADIRREINELKRHRFISGWLNPTLAAAAGATLAVLVGAALHK